MNQVAVKEDAKTADMVAVEDKENDKGASSSSDVEDSPNASCTTEAEAAPTKKEKRKHGKKPGPLPPKSAYWLFIEHEHLNQKKAAPLDVTFKQLAEALQQQWSTKMSRADKAKYEQMAKADKERFAREKQAMTLKVEPAMLPKDIKRSSSMSEKRDSDNNNKTTKSRKTKQDKEKSEGGDDADKDVRDGVQLKQKNGDDADKDVRDDSVQLKQKKKLKQKKRHGDKTNNGEFKKPISASELTVIKPKMPFSPSLFAKNMANHDGCRTDGNGHCIGTHCGNCGRSGSCGSSCAAYVDDDDPMGLEVPSAAVTNKTKKSKVPPKLMVVKPNKNKMHTADKGAVRGASDSADVAAEKPIISGVEHTRRVFQFFESQKKPRAADQPMAKNKKKRRKTVDQGAPTQTAVVVDMDTTTTVDRSTSTSAMDTSSSSSPTANVLLPRTPVNSPSAVLGSQQQHWWVLLEQEAMKELAEESKTTSKPTRKRKASAS